MCGICGWLNLNRNIDYSIVEKMNNIVSYRGPDDEGYASISEKGIRHYRGNDTCIENLNDFSELKNDKPFLVLAHRRLSILDLSIAGHQPMQTADGNFCITYNGEIYNYIEIRNELEIKGYHFESMCDTEILLYSYQEWGENCVNHFNGMWAFAIWDVKKHKLFCSRDRLGAKPFYYYIKDDEFIFSSEIKQLCENSRIKKRLNESVLTTQIMWSISDYSNDTLIQNIKCLMGGKNLIIQLDNNNSKIKTSKVYDYWDIDTEKKDIYAEKEVFQALENAIHLRTRSDVPIGVLLSGGIDSSCIVAEVSDYLKKEKATYSLNTFTSCYDNFKEGDETEYAHMVNVYCGATEHMIYPDSQDTFSDFSDMVWHLEGNCSFNVLGSYLMLKEVASYGVKVLINGQGSDETMFGYERYYAFYFADLLKKGEFSRLITEFMLASENSKLNIWMLIQYFIYFTKIRVRRAMCFSRMEKYVTDFIKKEFKKNKTVDEYMSHKSLADLAYNELRKIQLTHILRMDDRLYMSQSLESRVPFIDYKYVETAEKVFEERKIQKGYTKYLLRQYYETKLPQEVIWRKNKMGWPSPKQRWVRNFDEKKVMELFDNATTKKYFNIHNLKKLYQKDPTAYPVEMFMITELFVRRFNVEIP